MARFVGYAMLAVAAFSAVLAVWSVQTMVAFLDAGVVKPTAKLEIIVLVLCGVVTPLGIAGLLLKKP